MSAFDLLWGYPGSTRGYLSLGNTSVTFHGQAQGKATAIGASTVGGLGRLLVVHEEGHSYWASRGDRGYAPARIHTLLIESTSHDPDHHVTGDYRYVELTDTELIPSQHARATKHASIITRLNPITE